MTRPTEAELDVIELAVEFVTHRRMQGDEPTHWRSYRDLAATVDALHAEHDGRWTRPETGR